MKRIVRTDASPLQILTELEQARAVRAAGDEAVAWEYVENAYAKLAEAKAGQDQVLDEVTRTPERPAERITPPQGEGMEP